MGRYGMAGSYYRRSGYVTLTDVPDPNREYVEVFDNLVGGMNRFDLDYKLKGHESPFVQNLSWHNGTLCSRWGQVEIGRISAGVVAVAPFLFHGWLLIHADHHVYAFKAREDGNSVERPVGTSYELSSTMPREVPDVPGGTFFRYREDAYYKARGVYLRFTWDEEHDTVNAQALAQRYSPTPGTTWRLSYEGVYVPVVQINTDPATGSGELYQPENRLSAKKTISFITTTGTTELHLPEQYRNLGAYYSLTEDGVEVDPATYSFSPISGVVSFTGTYTPPAGDNRVALTFTMANNDAFDSIMDCTAVAVFGGAQDLCVVVGGCDAQPNAFFWSGNNRQVMDPTYFPMSQYNLAGDTTDPITAFGKQQNMLVIFQPHATGRVTFGTEKINGREQVTMNYTRINTEIGCDLPGSLQLVENNLVWCNRRYGVCRLKNSSAAYENNIMVISRKINGDYRVPGLLNELAGVDDRVVRSVDTGRKYMLVFGTNAYEWNYELSESTNPSWFFHTGILGVGFAPDANDVLYEVTETGVVASFQSVFTDFGRPIEKVYTFPPRNFGSYDRLKNIRSMIFTTRGDANTNTIVTYECDYGTRQDPTNLRSHVWSLVPRDLSFRDLSCPPYSVVFRRKPGYHTIRHLGVRLYNNEAGHDLSIESAQIFYDFRGRQR